MRVVVKPYPCKPSLVFTLTGSRLGSADVIDLRSVTFLPGGRLEGDISYSYGLHLEDHVSVDPREVGIGIFRLPESAPRVVRQMFRDYAWKDQEGSLTHAGRVVVSTGKILVGGKVRRQR